MSFFHYFSSDANKRAKYIFNLIAPVYAKVDHALVDNYDKSIDLVKKTTVIEGKKILDIGTGTGAWAAMFLKNNAEEIQGVDFSKKMLQVAKSKHPKIQFSYVDAEDLSTFDDNSFDIITASYVLHGVKANRRAKILKEMKRLSKERIIIHDFVGRTPVLVRFLEFMEKSDYINFKKNFCEELKIITDWEVKKIKSKDGSGLYIATNPEYFNEA